MEPTFSKEFVENLIKEIIHQDSFGDIHFKANEICHELGLNITPGDKEFQKIRQELIEEYGLTDDDMNDESVEGDLNMEAREEFRHKYGFDYD